MRDNLYDKEFKYTGLTFGEMVGEAAPLNDAVGRIAINFSTLEDEISSAITFLLKTSPQKGLLITSEMSFRAKLNVFSSLLKQEYEAEAIDDPIPESDLKDLLYMCSKSEELRNRLLHSSWVHDHSKQEIRRRKLSSRIKHGFTQEEEALTPGQILDIADYIIYTAVSVEEFVGSSFESYEPLLRDVIHA